ncbi:MAG: ethanolamine utilization protein EutN [Candidatus Marinimicrobia bacterium]|nr:ethanolamine utilization protein EutN [Candidatus Neomarinimicrobiota bacterium]
MILGRVIGSIVSTIKDDCFHGEKLLIVRPVDVDGSPHGGSFISLDRANAGKGDLVLVNKEGGGAKIMYGRLMTVQAVIVGVVDQVQIEYTGN